MTLVLLKRVVCAFFRIRNPSIPPKLCKKLDLTYFLPPSSFFASFTMPPKRKAVLEAAKLDPEIDSPVKRRKVAKKTTTKKEQASASTEKLPTTTNKTEESDKSAPATRRRRKPSENKAESKKAPKTGKPSEQTETEPAASNSKDEESKEELPTKAKRGKQSEKVTKAVLQDEESQDEVKLLKKAKKGKQSKKTETEPAASNSKDEESKEELPTKAVLQDEESQDEVKLLKKAKLGKESDTETQSALSNTTDTKWDHIDFGCNKNNPRNKGYNLKVTSWNIGGLRAWLKKSGMRILDHDQPDIFCLQETKCSNEKLPKEVRDIPGYHDYWVSSQKEGYAGVAVYTKIVPENVIYGIGKEDFDNEGRCITLEFEGFYLVNVYVPNAGRKLVTLPKRLEWNDHFEAFIKNLDQSKPVIICGDMNVAHTEIDLANPKTNQKNAGFTIEERDGMTHFLKCGYVDTFRHLYPEITKSYTFWSYMSNSRAKNVGWRLDYFILSERIVDKVCDCVIRSQIYGSDHCPISLFISI